MSAGLPIVPATAVLCSIPWLSVAAFARPSDLLPPLPRSLAPVATYGELAPGVVHPGIDLPTLGAAQPIAAAADGEIVRVRVSGGGYGRCLHLRLADGREVVYAHLSSFPPAIEDSCDRRQRAAGSYELDWRPARGSFPVSRGEWIGRTGETEAGRPILHLEVWKDGTPRNPLTEGCALPDPSPPRIRAIRIVPLAAASRVQGRLAPLRLALPAERKNDAPLAESVVWGPIGIETEADDPAGAERAAPWALRMTVDGRLQYAGDIGRRIAGAEILPDAPDPEFPDTLRQRLYEPPLGDRGSLLCGTSVAPGRHRLRISVLDAAGNADSVDTILLVQAPPRVVEWISRPLGGGSWDLGVRVATGPATDPETFRVWVDLTEDGRRFPVRSLLGHLGEGWFLGEVASLKPSGPMGVRVRMQMQQGIEAWEPAVRLDASFPCPAGEAAAPRARARPRWCELSVDPPCLPSEMPKAIWIVDSRRSVHEPIEVPPGEGDRSWRFAIPARRGASGRSPRFSLSLDQASQQTWDLPQLLLGTPSSEMLWTSPDGALTVEIPAATFYAPVWLEWTRTERPEEIVAPKDLQVPRPSAGQDEVLRVASDSYRLEPGDLELDGFFRVTLRPRTPPDTGEEAARLAIYGRRDPGSPWICRGGVWTGSAVVAVVDRLEEWILLEDRTEPWIYALVPAPGERVATVPTLQVRVREEGSGLRAKDLSILLDGRPLPSAWNPWSRTVTARPENPVEPGRHLWEMRARDRAGNAARRLSSFTLVQAP
ncbi:MAG: M23 family metallopeptidase [Candidatus Eisenbacteria bacterium]